jgi:putative transcriptional regulator
MRKPMRHVMKKTAKKTMSKVQGYKSAIKAAIHETASDLHELGFIDKQTMRRFDKSCLTPVHDFTGKEIRELRERENVSQMIFARYLNVRKDSVTQWERGLKRPSGPTLKLLCLVQKKGLDAIA